MKDLSLRIVLATALAAMIGVPQSRAQYPAADNFNPSAAAEIWGTAVQTDGKIILGGLFTAVGGQSRSFLARVNADGSLDSKFNPGSGQEVYLVALQEDKRILLGGTFSTIAGQTRNGIARLNLDGTLDTQFNPGVGGPKPHVIALLVQPDGKILLGGRFTQTAGQTRLGIARVNPDGTLDATFNPGVTGGGDFGGVYAVGMQADGKILLGGEFTNVSGQPRASLARLNADGSLDQNFNPGTKTPGWPAVATLAVQADGKILVGGALTNLVGTACNRLGRLNADGTLETTFNTGANAFVASLALQTDGQILVGGRFTTLMGQARNYLGRINADGTLDSAFNPDASGGSYPGVFCLALQPDGKILVGGGFATLGGQTRNRIGRLNNTAPATERISFDGQVITWLRSGTSPEVWRTTFEYLSGTNWIGVGPGARIDGGWQSANIDITHAVSIRARGHLTCGQDNGSGWFVETLTNFGAPLLVEEPADRTNNVGTEAVLRVLAEGVLPLSYQWRKDGSPLAGATNFILTLASVRESDQGSYSVLVSNPVGFVISSAALLVVNQSPLADSSGTLPLYISCNGTNATIIFNGTGSYDPDGDTLQYAWYAAGNTNSLAHTPVAAITLPIGSHLLLLVVADETLASTNAFSLQVVTSYQALERLAKTVETHLSRTNPLLASLFATQASIARASSISAINQLQAFQNKVQAQVTPLDCELAADLIQSAQDIIDSLRCNETTYVDRRDGHFTRVNLQPGNKLQLQFSGNPSSTYILETSTNMVAWEQIGVVTANPDGNFTIEAPKPASCPSLFYRLLLHRAHTIASD